MEEKKERIIEIDKIKEIVKDVYVGLLVGCIVALYYLLRIVR